MSFQQHICALGIFIAATACFGADDPPKPEAPKKPKTKEETIAAIPVEPLDDGVLLQFGDVKILTKDIERGLKAAWIQKKKTVPSYEETPKDIAEMKKQLAFNRLGQVVIENYVADNKLTVPKEAVDGELKRFKSNKDQYENFLDVNGFTDEEFTKFATDKVTLQEELKSKFGKDVTDADVTTAFTDRTKLRRASDILFMYKGSTGAPPAIKRSREEAKAAAEDTLKKIKEKPELFMQAVQDLSDSPSRKDAGDLNWLAHRGSMIEAITEALYKLEKVGDVSDVIESPFGFHIIKMTGLKTLDEVKAAAEPAAFEKHRADVKSALTYDKVGAEMQRMIEAAVAKAKFNAKEVKVP